MISTAIIFAWLHVFFAVCWIGAAVLTAVVIEPAARSFSAQASVEFVKKFIPRLGKFMGIITTFTIIFGALFFYAFTGGRIFADPPSPWESLMYAGALLGIVAYIFGIVIMLPLTKKIERATKEFEANPDSANTSLQTQMSRLRSISILDLALLIAVFTLMALATYY
jgi:uncharacterized membrane protein